MVIPLKYKALAVLSFVAGMWVSLQVAVFTNYFHRISCGDQLGYTTLASYEQDELICVWRQNSYPFKTLSGRKA